MRDKRIPSTSKENISKTWLGNSQGINDNLKNA